MAQQAIEDAKRQIANRKKFLKNLKPGEIAKVANIRTVSEEGLAKAKRAADLQARITQAMARQPGTLGVGAGPQPIILGQDGRRVDAVTGDIVEFRKATPSVLANQNVQFRDELKHMAKQTAKAKVCIVALCKIGKSDFRKKLKKNGAKKSKKKIRLSKTIALMQNRLRGDRASSTLLNKENTFAKRIKCVSKKK